MDKCNTEKEAFLFEFLEESVKEKDNVGSQKEPPGKKKTNNNVYLLQKNFNLIKLSFLEINAKH